MTGNCQPDRPKNTVDHLLKNSTVTIRRDRIKDYNGTGSSLLK